MSKWQAFSVNGMGRKIGKISEKKWNDVRTVKGWWYTNKMKENVEIYLDWPCAYMRMPQQWRQSHWLPFGCMLWSLIPYCTVCGVFSSPSDERFYYLWDALRGEASMYTEPLEDFDILVCPFIPFRTCSWCSQPHTATIAVWHFELTLSQYIVISRSAECLPEFDFKGMSHAFWCYLSVPQPEVYI